VGQAGVRRLPRPAAGRRRGDRHGFPPELVEALLALSQRHAEQFRFRAPGEHDCKNVPMRDR
jgi:hypothetical protein